MSREPLRLIFLFFAIFLLVQALSGLFLFVVKMGYTPEHITEYFYGSEEKFIPAKSFWGILEVVVFHLGGVYLYALFMSHFLFLFPARAKFILWIIYMASLGNILSGFLIRYGERYFALLKLVFFVCFELATLCFIGALVIELISGFFSRRIPTNL